MIICSGPFFCSESPKEFTLFERLLNFVYEQRPQVFLLIGPFIPPSPVGSDVTTYPEELFQRELVARLRVLTSRTPNLRLLVVPSKDDLLADPVFPQPAYPSQLFPPDPTILLLPNPALVSINGIILGISSHDPLAALAGVEFHRGTSHVDPLQRICNHLTQQANHCPRQPCAPGVNLDFNLLGALELPSPLPHLLILSSHMRCFAKPSNGTTIINPGLLSAGSLAHVKMTATGKRIEFYHL